MTVIELVRKLEGLIFNGHGNKHVVLYDEKTGRWKKVSLLGDIHPKEIAIPLILEEQD